MNRRTTQPPQRWSRTGLLAVDPKAFFELFMVPTSRDNERHGDIDVIEISGPLVQREEMWCDSYESIRRRFRAACEGDARAIVLRIDSPGGDASGCFETARALRAEAAAANKPLYAYVDRACSAAYALASAANGIAIGETCCAGSVGVLSSREDVTALNAQRGLRMAFVVSGLRKLDGNPDSPITDDELIQTQKHVDDLAGKFFALIGDMRPQLPAATVAGFDGGVFYGDAAVSAGLADAVATFDELLAIASGRDAMTMLAKSDYDAARASLEKVAKGKDANAAAAKRALAAMTAEDPPPEEEEEPAAAAEGDDEEPAAEGEDDEPAAEGDAAPPAAASEDEPPADKKPKSEQAASASTELTLAAQVHSMRAELDAEKTTRIRNRLIASRPDFGSELKAALRKAPLSTVREMVKTLPRGKVQKPKAITTLPAARGAGQANTPAVSSELDDMDRRMGLSTSKLGCRRDGATLYFGVMAAEKTPDAGAA